MSFTEALTKAQQEFRKGPVCTVAVVLAAHPEADKIKAAISERAIPGTIIARALAESGSKVGSEAIQRHRRGACSCESQ